MAKDYIKPWIKMWKKSMSHPLYQNGKPFDEWHAWQDILFMCDNEGTFKTTLKGLQIRWNWNSIKAVRAYLGTLKGTNMIEVKGTFGRHGGITIKALKYWAYQSSPNAAKRQNGHIKNGTSGHIKGHIEVLNTEEGGMKPPFSTVSTPSDNSDDFDVTKVDFDD
jgi:hypothetical protein